MSMRNFKRAWEAYDETPNGDGKIEMKGPLSNVYSQALQEVFKRPSPTEGETSSNETAANDELTLRRLAEDLFNPPESGTSTVLYGVDRGEVTPEDVVSITKEYEANPDVPVVLIMDGTTPGPNGQDDSEPVARIKHLTDALESICHASGGQIYATLKDYARARYA